MTLQELGSAEDVKDFLGKNAVGVICFSAHWCGPCKASKPQLEALAKTSKVPVSIVHESDLGDTLHDYKIRAFPTYVIFHNGTELQRIEGVNLQGVQEMIDAHASKAGPSIPETGGYTMGGGSNNPASAEDARALRLARFGGGAAAATSETSTATPMDTEDDGKKKDDDDSKPAATTEESSKDDGGATKEDAVMEDADDAAAAAPKKKNPADDLDPAAIKTLTEDMGFALIRAQKGLLYSPGKSVESAVEWLTQHQDDADIDDPIPLVDAASAAGGTATSYKCTKTGKIFKSVADLELYANRTGYTDFEESTETVKPRTEEEKAAKIAEVKELLRARRAQREEAEKVDDTEREKQRRFMGKEMAQTREQLEKEQRKREALARKREKAEQKRERERIRAELEKDKRERLANKGKLKGRLGVDGYAPSAIQYDQKADGSGGDQEQAEDSGEPPLQKPKKSGASAAKIDEYIGKVSSYRAGGDGGKCLKVLVLLVGNAADNPTEDKFKSVNTETKAYKNKIKPFVGAKQLLMAVGFGIPEEGDKTRLVLKPDADYELLKATKTKLQQALEKYEGR